MCWAGQFGWRYRQLGLLHSCTKLETSVDVCLRSECLLAGLDNSNHMLRLHLTEASPGSRYRYLGQLDDSTAR